ncbi:hypothetical protein, partial [Escherichia coli]|uniref:hypothetical protein n=1 Tax=Escherichia coli TaxID=562 RepID=UPI001FF1D6E4
KNYKNIAKQLLKKNKDRKNRWLFCFFLASENDILFYLSFSRKMQTSISYKQAIIIKIIINQ